MYKKERNHQFRLNDFNQPIGLKMNPENRWVKKADLIPWEEIEERYAALFPSHTGMPAKPLRVALGSLLIQKQYAYSDRELVEQITENPYYQYFIGLHGYQQEAPYAPSLLVEFRKRLTDEILGEINELILQHNHPADPGAGTCGTKQEEPKECGNCGTIILDATCAPQNIEYPQDINLLNEARELLEKMIDTVCYEYNTKKPRMYRRNARKDYLALAKRRKRSGKAIRKAIRKQLQYVRRNLGYIDSFLSEGKTLSTKDASLLAVLRKVYEQQHYMYENNTHSVSDRIVSISQPYIRPIVRGKSKTPTEFGAKLDLSIDDYGMARIERQSFDAYNESDVLVGAIERYRERTGHYPERVLADTIYRNRNNLAYCRLHGIRLSGPALGRPKKNHAESKKQEYIDSVDRIEVERSFSLAKRCFGLGLIRTKLETTTRSSISMSIIAMNVARLAVRSLFKFLTSISRQFFMLRNRENCVWDV
ncbi:MAG: IS5 family transposase [Oscillospiraceae bacterium]|nr:IS5 family transposase [Oscillospiraceae bacterium]